MMKPPVQMGAPRQMFNPAAGAPAGAPQMAGIQQPGGGMDPKTAALIEQLLAGAAGAGTGQPSLDQKAAQQFAANPYGAIAQGLAGAKEGMDATQARRTGQQEGAGLHNPASWAPTWTPTKVG